eukprot:g1892.t1
MSTLAVALDFIRQSGYLNAEPVSMPAPRGGSRPAAQLHPAPQCLLAVKSGHDAPSCGGTPVRTSLELHLSSPSLLAMASGCDVPASSTSRRRKEKASTLSTLPKSQDHSMSSVQSDSRKRQRPTTVYTSPAMPFHVVLSYRSSRRKMSAHSASAFSDSTGDALDQSVLERPMPSYYGGSDSSDISSNDSMDSDDDDDDDDNDGDSCHSSTLKKACEKRACLNMQSAEANTFFEDSSGFCIPSSQGAIPANSHYWLKHIKKDRQALGWSQFKNSRGGGVSSNDGSCSRSLRNSPGTSTVSARLSMLEVCLFALRSCGKALTAKEIHTLAVSNRSDLRFFMRLKSTKHYASQIFIMKFLTSDASKDRIICVSETNFDRNGSDDSPDVTSAGSTTSGAKQGSDATGESLCGSHVLVFSPDELAFHEAKVTHFYPKTGSYRILLVATVRRPLAPGFPASGGIVIWIADVYLDGTIHRAGVEYQGINQLLGAMETMLGEPARASSSSEAASVKLAAEDPWSMIRYRLPGGRSVSLARVRQAVVDVFGRFVFS